MSVEITRLATRTMDVPEAVNARLGVLWEKYGPLDMPRTIRANRKTITALLYTLYPALSFPEHFECDYGCFDVVRDDDLPTGHLLLYGERMAVLIGPEW